MADRDIKSIGNSGNNATFSTPGNSVAGSGYALNNINIDQDTAYEFNTYNTDRWGSFYLLMEPINDYDKDGNKIKTYNVNAEGVKSLFNNVNALPRKESFRLNTNTPLFDSSDTRRKIRLNNDCSIKALVNASEAGLMGRAIYRYADFMYCKYLGRISNNYMITLRRFPMPCSDYITYTNPYDETGNKLQDHAPDIGRLVTWMGTPGNDMGNILKYNYKMPYKELHAKLDQKQDQGDNANGPLAKIFNAADKTYQKQVQQGRAGSQAFEGVNSLLGGGKGEGPLGNPPYGDAEWTKNYDQNKTYGPIDVIKKTWIRGEEGLEFTQDISITFDYELRSYDGVNGRAAFLDLLANILAVTYTTGKFWGGGYHFFGAHQSNLYANLPIFKDAEKGNINSYAQLQSSIMDSINQVSTSLKNQYGGKDMLETFKNVMSSFGGMLLGGILNKLGRPQKMALQSLLSPAPTGMWHLTIGNPRAPIMSIGNLILDNCEIEHYGPLGLDDFPTGIKVTCKLKHGKPRDISTIEQMYMKGDNRIYTPMGSAINRMYEAASEVKGTYVNNSTLITSTSDIDQAQTAISRPTGSFTNARGYKITASNANTMSGSQKVYQKFFGTRNMKTINIAGLEGAFGSNTEGASKSTGDKTK